MAHYAYKNDGGDIGEVLSVLGDTWCLVSSVALFFFVFRSNTREKFNQRLSQLTETFSLTGSGESRSK